MKLRILGNSIRLRLTRGEVDRVCAGEWVEERTHFAPAPAPALSYRIGPGANIDEARANFTEGTVSVELPADFLSTWASNTTVGTEARQSLEDGQSLRILVEKDFKCLTPREDEDQSDTFANPLESHGDQGDAC
jgi:hypothetical protein